MSSAELMPRRGRTAAERQHVHQLAGVLRRAELAEAEAACVSRVTQRAIVEALSINFVRAEAERLDIDGAEQYRYLAARGIMRMAMCIDRV
jgi:hypothetical protein